MDCNRARRAVLEAIADRWSCETLSDGRLVVASPLTYSDGDHPEVAIAITAGGGLVRLTDFGSTLQRLSLHDLALGMPRFDAAMRAIAAGFGLHLTDGELQCEGPASEVGDLLLVMSAAMLQLDALAVLRTEPRRPRFDAQLSLWLSQSFPGKVRKRTQVRGRTGKRWSVTAVSASAAEPVYVQPVSRADGDGSSIDHADRMFSELVDGQSKLVVLADDPSVYDPPDLQSLETVAAVGSWAQRDRMLPFIGAPSNAVSPRLYELAGSTLDW